MAFNKSKALEEAARLVSQRKIPQAINQYLAIAQQDPNDLPLHNMIGDLWVREGNIGEALREFHTLADAYTREGFFLKAIAIYKKIVKLDAQSPAPYLKLAELYSGQKLSHEANEQYAQALALCERNSLHDHARQILKKLVAQDPRNGAYRARLAELLRNTGQLTEACQTFLEAARLSYHHKDIAAAGACLKKAAQIEPQNPQVLLFQARLAAEAKHYQDVDRIFSSAPEMKSNPEGRSLLLSVYFESGRFDAAAALAVEAYRHNSEGFEAVAQFTAYCLEAGNPDAALGPLGEIADLVFERSQSKDLFGLIHHLLAAHPGHGSTLELVAALCDRVDGKEIPLALLETLGTAFAVNGQWARAEKAFRLLTGRDSRNPAWQNLLREAIEKQRLGRDGGVSTPQETGPQSSTEEVTETLPASHAPVTEETPEPQPIGATEKSNAGSGHSAAPEEAAVAGTTEAIEVDFSAEWEDFSATHSETRAEPALEAGPEPEPEHEFPPPATLCEEFSAPVAEPETSSSDLKPQTALRDMREATTQAQFYLDSGFLSEAGAALKDLAGRFPGEPQVKELQERLEAMMSAGTTGPLLAPDQAEPVEQGESDSADAGSIPGLPAPELPGMAEVTQTDVATPSTQSQIQRSSLLDDLTQELEMALGEEEGSPPPAPSAAQSQGEPGVSLFDSALEELLSELETGHESPPADDSPERHYNLGVAFREMGLLDEAIGEFQKVVKGRSATENPPRLLEASSLLGNCFMEKQMPEIAAQWYLRALQAPGLDEEITLALTYDLAIAYEKCGNLKAAQEKFSEVYSLNIDYRDVSEKIQWLRSKRA